MYTNLRKKCLVFLLVTILATTFALADTPSVEPEQIVFDEEFELAENELILNNEEFELAESELILNEEDVELNHETIEYLQPTSGGVAQCEIPISYENAPVTEESASTKENMPPVAEDLEFTTFRDVMISGNLVATDPDGDLFEFQLIREPRRGQIELDTSTGEFSYTPDTRRRRDTFTYVAVDAYGNISKEATVTINISRQSSSVSYVDMHGHSAHVSALTLAENNIFIGEQIGERHFFNPDSTVSRGEFLTMVMRMGETELITGVTRTSFVDDHAIADWLRPYVATAVYAEIVHGVRTSDGVVFNPNQPITLAEAAVMLNHALGLYATEICCHLAEVTVPAWAKQSMVNVSSFTSIPLETPHVYNQTLTRANAAELLVDAIRYAG